MIGELAAYYFDLCRGYDVALSLDKWQWIERAYEGRPYHNLEHVSAVMDRADLYFQSGLGLDQKDRDAVRLAILYHDVVYIPGYPENELLSAGWLASHFNVQDEIPIRKWLIGEAMRLILLTKEHRPKPDDVVGQIICDADLYMLSTDKYDENTKKIREEFKVSNKAWRNGRSAFLADMMLRLAPFFNLDDPDGTSADVLEERAQKNLRREWDTLNK